MKQTLKYTPSHYKHKDILMKFAEGKPLSCDQLNFLAQHEKTLSSPHLDHVMKYYLKHYHHHDYENAHSFLMPSDEMTAESILHFRDRLQLLLKQQPALQFKWTPEQFMRFKAVTYHELILYHGNQFLSGAPFYPGGHPHVIYFQWGNLFGVAKYVVLPEERALRSNVFIYFEDRRERLLNECIAHYQQHVLKQTPTPPTVTPKPEPTPTPSVFKTPRLTLSQNSKEREEK